MAPQPSLLLLTSPQSRPAALIRMLSAEGWRIVTGAPSPAALARVNPQSPPNVVLIEASRVEAEALAHYRNLGGAGSARVMLGLPAPAPKLLIQALEAGADDVVDWNSGAAEITARLRAILRRDTARRASLRSQLWAGAFRLDLAAHRAYHGGQELDLSLKEFRLLELLMRHPGQTLEYVELFAAAWGRPLSNAKDRQTFDTHIVTLRRKVGHGNGAECCICTVLGRGFRFEPRCGRPPTVLIVDHDRSSAGRLAGALAKAGYAVDCTADGLRGRELALTTAPDVILLDLLLPGLDGLSLLRGLRRQSDVPAIIVSARGSALDQCVGLDTGADDYVVKPVDLPVLLARLRALLRRASDQAPPGRGVLTLGDRAIDLEASEIRMGAKAIRLSRLECAILAALVENRGGVVSRQRLIERAWGPAYKGDSHTLDTHIQVLVTLAVKLPEWLPKP